MKKIIPVLFCGLVLAACGKENKNSDMKSHWVEISSAELPLLVDQNSIKGKNEKTFWAKVVKSNEEFFLYTKIDCANNRYSELEYRTLVKGKPGSHEKNQNPQYFQIVPDTNYVKIRNFVCKIDN